MPKFIAMTILGAMILFIASSMPHLVSQSNPLPSEKEEKTSEKKDSILNTFKKSLTGEEKDQINFLFLGIGGEEHVSGYYLTDTIIIVSFKPSTKKAAVISIPRDLLIRSPNKGYFTRINALYAMDSFGKGFPGPMGIELIREKIKDIVGLAPDYYLVLDLAAVAKIVDTLNGVYVRREEDLVDNRFPDDNYGYETYKINEGWRYLNGEEAVRYIRTRHTSGGDFDRMKRQQEVARAIKKKADGLKSVSGLPKLFSIYKTLSDHLATNLEFAQISRLMELVGGVKDEDIIFDRITAQQDGLLIYDSVELDGKSASILKPRAGLENYEEIKAKIKNVIKQL